MSDSASSSLQETPCLDQQNLDLFWQFIAKRQEVWYQRTIQGEASPWTDNEIIRNYRFTNIYRELDPGTQYAIQNILERDECREDKIFNVMVYRLIGRLESHEELGFQRLDEFDRGEFESTLKKRRDGQEEPVFTGAYLVSGYNQMGSSDKVENVAAIFETVADGFNEFYSEVEEANELKEVYSAIRDQPGFGNFLSYQVMVDLLYPLQYCNGESLLPFSHDEWSAAGPGAQRGLEVLMKDASENDDLEVMRWLRANQVEEFDRLELDFKYLRSNEGGRVEISLANIQNCLCEFYKYHKMVNDEGRARRRFRNSNSRPVQNLRQIYSNFPISLNPDDY